MNFLDGSLFPENQDKLVITVAPYGPEWMPSDFPEDIAVTIDEQVQKAVDCYNAGATVLHVHVRELDGKGSKRLSKFNELLGRLRIAVPEMVLQVGGSISFAPETEGAAAKWLSDDTRHMLAELDPKPDQVTVTVNTSQMNVVEQMCEADLAGTSLAEPANYNAYREMTVPGGPGWAEEHVRRLSAAGIQSAFQFYNINSFETVERMIRRGVYKGPLVMNWVAIGGGMDAPNIYNLANFVRATPDGAMLTLESSMLNTLPVNMMAIAMGLHVRCGIEDNLWTQDRKAKMSSVKQVEQLVRISREFGREVATGKEAREICKIGDVLRQHRRDAGAQRFRAEPQSRSARGVAARGGLTVKRTMRTMTMAQAIRFHKAGGPEVLQLEEIEVGHPGPGQVRIRHVAVGLNFADTYFRTGLYPDPAAERHGRRGVRRGRGGRRRRDQRCARTTASRTPVSSTRWAPTAPNGSSPSAPLIKLPDSDLLRDRGGDDDARPDLGVPDAPHLAAARGRHHPAARRRRRCRPDRVAVGEAARPHRHRHRLDRGEGRRCPRPRLRSRHRLPARGRREARARADRRRRRAGRLRQRRQGHLRRPRSTR